MIEPETLTLEELQSVKEARKQAREAKAATFIAKEVLTPKGRWKPPKGPWRDISFGRERHYVEMQTNSAEDEEDYDGDIRSRKVNGSKRPGPWCYGYDPYGNDF